MIRTAVMYDQCDPRKAASDYLRYICPGDYRLSGHGSTFPKAKELDIIVLNFTYPNDGWAQSMMDEVVEYIKDRKTLVILFYGDHNVTYEPSDRILVVLNRKGSPREDMDAFEAKYREWFDVHCNR